MATNMTFFNKKSGYSLVELLVYVSLLTIISILVVNTTLSFTQSYRTLTALRLAEHSGIDAMERMTRDIRAATSVDSGNSTLGSSPGTLTLIATSASVSTTTKFYIQGNTAKVDVNGSYVGPLTVSGVSVTGLTFTLLNSGVSQAVKIDMSVQATSGQVTKTKTYHSTVVLRG